MGVNSVVETNEADQDRLCPFDFADGLKFDPVMRAMLQQESITRVRLPYGSGSAWIVARDAEVRMVTTDPRFSRAAAVGVDFPRMTPVPIAPPDALMMLDPPDSGRVRAALARAFSMYGSRRLRAHADATVTELLDRLHRAGPPADLVADLAKPLPMRLIWDVLGIPAPDQGWLRAQIDPIKDTDPNQDQPARHSHQSIHEYLAELAAERRRHSRPDMLSALVAPHGGATSLTDEEVAALAVSLILGGHDNMTNSVANITYMLLTRTELYQTLIANPRLLPAVLDELLRYIPYHRGVGTPRIATEDVTLSGSTIAAGDVVYVSYVAASRDPQRYPDPDDLEPARYPTGHLAFGWGPHRCPATTLVMTVLQTVFTHLPRRMPTLALATAPEDIRWNTTSVLRSPLTLPAQW